MSDVHPAMPLGSPEFRPDQLLGARHDTPDQTGPLTDWEPVATPLGSPPASGQPERLTEHVPVRFDPATVEAAKALAGAEGMTVSAWIRREVEREVSRREAVKVKAPGGAQEAVTPVERVALALEAERDRWRSAATMEGDHEMARARNAIGSAWNRAAAHVRDALAPQWDALAAERDSLRQAYDGIRASRDHLREQCVRLGAGNERLRAVLEAIDPAKLDRLADWFDMDDARPAPGRGVEVQADLRRWAKTVRAALEAPDA